jgi:hypothetical protein
MNSTAARRSCILVSVGRSWCAGASCEPPGRPAVTGEISLRGLQSNTGWADRHGGCMRVGARPWRTLWVVVAMTELVLVASCVSSPPTSRDRKLLSLVGADAVSGWRCQPVGPRRLPTLWRRHEVCVAEERKADRLLGISVDRDPSGHVSGVLRTWATHDSLVWQQLRDSLTAVIAVEIANGAHCATRLSAADSAHAALARSTLRRLCPR